MAGDEAVGGVAGFCRRTSKKKGPQRDPQTRDRNDVSRALGDDPDCVRRHAMAAPADRDTQRVGKPKSIQTPKRNNAAPVIVMAAPMMNCAMFISAPRCRH